MNYNHIKHIGNHLLYKFIHVHVSQKLSMVPPFWIGRCSCRWPSQGYPPSRASQFDGPNMATRPRDLTPPEGAQLCRSKAQPGTPQSPPFGTKCQVRKLNFANFRTQRFRICLLNRHHEQTCTFIMAVAVAKKMYTAAAQTNVLKGFMATDWAKCHLIHTFATLERCMVALGDSCDPVPSRLGALGWELPAFFFSCFRPSGHQTYS